MTGKAKLWYRLLLLVLLVAAVGGGIWYCYESYQESLVPEDGVLVREFLQNPDTEILKLRGNGTSVV